MNYQNNQVNLPEKYQGLQDNDLKVEFIFQEADINIRCLLIDRIGYSRISQELRLREVDHWREYQLLKVKPKKTIKKSEYLYAETIYLLKVICVKNNRIYLFHPPYNDHHLQSDFFLNKSARQAVIDLLSSHNQDFILVFKNISKFNNFTPNLFYDNKKKLHGIPAIQFVDNYYMYAYHGRFLPERYDKISPEKLQSKLILEEQDQYVNDILIQLIGLSRVYQELEVVEIDHWQEFILLKLKNVEHYALKITCSMTNHSHLFNIFGYFDKSDIRLAVTNLLSNNNQYFLLIFGHLCKPNNLPRQVFYDENKRLHGMPATQIGDDYIYAHHGIIFPEKYDKIHPEKLRPALILEEQNVEICRALIQFFGLSRVYQELEVVEIDHWQEFILLKLKNVEHYALKITCSMTNHIHLFNIDFNYSIINKSAINAVRRLLRDNNQDFLLITSSFNSIIWL